MSTARALLSFLVFALSAITVPGANAQASAADTASAKAPAAKTVKERIVVQVSDGNPRTWNQALNVVNNLQSAYGRNDVQVEIVAFGDGIGMLKMDSDVGSRIQQALASGAQVSACMNTMRGRKLEKADMASGISYVDSGAVEIVQKQRQGWAIIRP